MGQKTSGNRIESKLGAWAGMVASILFVTIFTLEGWFRPGYNPTSMFISELSLGPRGYIQIANFIVTGVLFVIFALGVAAEFREKKASKVPPLILVLVGISLIFSGPLVMDPANTPLEQMSLSGILHQLFGALVFLFAPISCFLFWRRFKVDTEWMNLKWWTLIATIIITVAVIVLRVASVQPPIMPDLNQFSGLIQRVVIVTYFAWTFTFALSLYRKTKKE
jgi:hypothetical protein